MSLAFAKTTDQHLHPLARNMRDADREEVFASSGHAPLQALELSLLASEDTTTALLDGEPVAIFGCARLADGIGGPWLLATDDFYKVNPRTVLEVTRAFVNSWLDRYEILANYVHHRNTTSIRWLKAAGFTIHEAVPFGHLQKPFHLFTRTRHV